MLGTVLAVITAAAAGLVGPTDAAASACAETAAACTDAGDEVAAGPVIIDESLLERCTAPAPPPESRVEGCPDQSYMVSRTAEGERAPHRLMPTPLRRSSTSLPGLSSGRSAPRPESTVAPAPAQPFALFEIPVLAVPDGRPFWLDPPGVVVIDARARLEHPPRAA